VRITILYGGTFDPIHNGHVAIALAALAEFNADVTMIPGADPPHRPPASATALQRAEMVELAIADYPGLHCDRRELKRHGKSYSILTLREVRAEIGPQAPLAWLIGSDAFSQIDTWRDWQQLFALAHFIVVERPGQPIANANSELQEFCRMRWRQTPLALLEQPAGLLYRLPMPLRGESSTRIRGSLAEKALMNADLAPAVAAYIGRHGLYASRV
jgi:nicotinate-nucleotide adenylyltransferase